MDLSTQIKDIKDQYQLIRLDNVRVVEQWNDLEQILVESFAHIKSEWNEDEKAKLLKHIADERIQCWGIFKGKELTAFMTTALLTEFWGERRLLIFSLYGFNKINIEVWRSLFSSLTKYARSERCTKIVAYTTNKRIIQIVKSIGGTFSAFIEMEI